MKSKRIQLLMLGALAFMASCGGSGEGGGEGDDSDSTTVVKLDTTDMAGDTVPYTQVRNISQFDDLSNESNHILFESPTYNDNHGKALVLMYLDKGRKVSKVDVEDYNDLNYGKSRTYLIYLEKDSNTKRRLSATTIDVSFEDMSEYATISAVLAEEVDGSIDKVFDRSVLMLQEPNVSDGAQSSNIKEMRNSTIKKTDHGQEFEEIKIIGDFPDECSVANQHIEPGYGKVGIAIPYSKSVKLKASHTEEIEGKNYLILDYEIIEKDGAEAGDIFVSDLIIPNEVRQGTEFYMIRVLEQVDGELKEKKKKVLAAKTGGVPATTIDCAK